MFAWKIVCPRYLLRFFGPEYLAHLVNSSHRFFVQSSIFELTQKNELRRRGVSSRHRALHLPWFPASGWTLSRSEHEDLRGVRLFKSEFLPFCVPKKCRGPV